jgi:hypothetical protein
MIYLFCGEDYKKKLQAYEDFLKPISLSKKEVFFVGKNDFNQAETQSFYSGSGLFFEKCTVVFTNIFEREENLDFILDKLDLIKESENDFVFLEGRLNKPVLDAFKEVGVKVNNFELPKEKKEKFNNFLLANAFGDKDKLNLWIYFRQAMDKGVGMEELAGVLFWKVKDMIINKNFGKISEMELKNIAGKLAYLLPEARREGKDAETVFEKFLLDIF